MPIDIATGNVRLTFDDVAVRGRVELVWNRLFSTRHIHNEDFPLGRGWTGQYFAQLTRTPEGFTFRTPEGDLEQIPNIDRNIEGGAVARLLETFEEVLLLGDRYVVQRWNAETGEIRRFCFANAAGRHPLRLTSVEDVTGEGLDVEWDRLGRLSRVVQRQEGRALLVRYNVSGFIASVAIRTPDGDERLLVRYEYDGDGHCTAVHDAAGYTNRYEYDARGRLVREIVKDGGVFAYRYDEHDRCLRMTGLGRYAEKTLKFFPAIRFTEVTDSYGHSYRYEHSEAGQILREIDPLGGETKTEYDEFGRIVSRVDPTGAATRYAYDANGNRVSVTDAGGLTTTFAYNSHHQMVELSEPTGGTWHWAYDASNHLTAVSNPVGSRWRIRYDTDGNPCEEVNPNGGRVRQLYDGGLLSTIVDDAGNATNLEWDGFGRIVRRTGPLGDTTRFEYDVFGNRTGVITPDGERLQYDYDAVGNLTAFVNGAGSVTRYEYGPCQRLLRRIDPGGGTTSYVWGTEPDRLEQLVNEKGETYSYERDPAGRITRKRGFDGVERQFKYDAAGFVISVTNGLGECITLRRDAMHRVVEQTLPDGEIQAFQYDQAGNLTAAVNATTTVTFERDSLGRITGETQDDAWVRRVYDAAGHVLSTATSLGHILEFDVDHSGLVQKLTAAGRQSLEFTYNGYHQETSRRTHASGFVNRQYDVCGRLSALSAGDSRLGSGAASDTRTRRTIIGRRYAYSQTGALISCRDVQAGDVTYAYDASERLTETVRAGGSSERFSYDATGNITSFETRGGNGSESRQRTLAYSAGNQLQHSGSARYEFDAAGRRTKKIDQTAGDCRVWEYAWDALDRLRAVKTPDGKTWRYTYDALARRIEKTDGRIRKRYVWDQDVVVHEIDEQDSVSSWVFEQHSFAPIATIQGGRLLSCVNDHLGTPAALIDETGTVVWSAATSSWGEDVTTAVKGRQTADCAIRFPGQWRDDEAGLHYARYRYYDPESGQFLSPDPIGLLGGANLYSYGPNPVNWIDPYGLNTDVKPATYEAPLQIEPGTPRVEVTKISSETGLPYQHVSHYDDQGRLIGQTHYTDHGRSKDHTVPHHHRRDPVTGQKFKSPPGTESGAGTRAWPGAHPAEEAHQEEEKKKKGTDCG